MDKVVAAKDRMAAEGVIFYKSQNMQGDDEFHLKHIDFYLGGIALQQSDLEMQLLQGGLLEKPVQEMTGFELKTLLLTTLKESQAGENQVKSKNAS